MKPLINLISRVFLVLALCMPLSAPVVANEWFLGEDGDTSTAGLLAELRELHDEGKEDKVFTTIKITPRRWNDGAYYLTTHLHFFSGGVDEDDVAVDWLLDKGMSPNPIAVRVLSNGKAKSGTAETPLDIAYGEAQGSGDSRAAYQNDTICKTIAVLLRYGGKTYAELKGGEAAENPCAALPESRPAPEPKADYTGLYANAAFALAGTFTPSWVDTQTFAFNEGNNFITGQSLSVPLNDFTFAASRVQVNDLTDYEFSVKWDWEF